MFVTLEDGMYVNLFVLFFIFYMFLFICKKLSMYVENNVNKQSNFMYAHAKMANKAHSERFFVTNTTTIFSHLRPSKALELQSLPCKGALC